MMRERALCLSLQPRRAVAFPDDLTRVPGPSIDLSELSLLLAWYFNLQKNFWLQVIKQTP
jgi:hypothetical protein